MERLKPIGREQIDALLKFLPVFEKPGLVIGGQVKGKGIMMAEWWYCEEVNEFVSRLYRDGWWLGDWDWGKWQNQARKYFERPEVIARARLLTLRKLLHLHVRKDRYCAGHLGLMFEQGHIQAILKRLEKLRDKKT